MKKYSTSTKNRLTIRLQTILLFVSFVMFIQVCSAQLPVPAVNNVVLSCDNDNFNITGIPGLGGNDIIWSDDYLNQTQLFQGLNYSSTTSSSFMLYAFTTDGAAASPDPKQTYIFRPQSATGIITESPGLCGNINLSFAIDSIIDSLTLIVSEDATIDPTDGATNFNNNFLNIRSEIYETGVHFLLKYDLSTIPLGVHPFYSHSAAMAYSGYAHGNNGNVYEQHVLDDSWDENTVTNNNAPLPLAPNSTADVAGNWWIWYGNPSYSVAHGNSATMGVSDEGNKAGINSNPLLNDLVNLEYMGDQTMSLYHFSPGYDTRYYSKDYKTDVALLPQLKIKFSYNLETDCTYSWTGPNGFTASTKDITDLSVSGLYTLQITNQYGCTSSYDYNAVINSISEDPSFTSVDFCETQGNVISGIATPGGTFSIVSQSGSNAVVIDPLTGLLTNHSAGDQITIQYNTSLSACQDSSVQTVNVLASTAPLFDVITPICSGEVLNPLPLISNNGVNGTWAPALDNTNTTIYTFTPNSGECANNTTLTITVNPSTTPIFDPVADVCTGGALNPLPLISNNGINGTWSPALDNTTTTTYTFSPDLGQCATTTTLTITVTASINPLFDPISSICDGDLLTPLPLISNNGVNGTWSPALDNTLTTNYTFIPDPGGCSSNTTLTITVNPSITPTFNPVTAICAGETLSALPLISTNGINGTWSPALNNLATTTYTFSPAIGECATNTTLTITVNPSTTPIFDPVADICSGEPLNALPVISNNGINGTWSPALDNTTTTTYTFSPDLGQCATTTTLTITVNPSVIPDFMPVTDICVGDLLNPLPLISTNGINGTWSPALDNTATTIYTFTPDAGQCASSTTTTITVNSLVNSTFDPIAAICEGDALTLPTLSTNTITGAWSPAFDNTTTTNYTFTPDAGQCASTASMTITVNTSTVPTFTAVADICEGVVLNTLPLNSNNAITGTWSPAINNTTTTLYTFTPNSGQCSQTTTMTIVVNPIDDAAFNYSSASFCVDDPNPIPTISGVTDGAFSIDGTGAINPTSGEIDILQSGAGNFSITYSTNGLCPSSFNFDLTLSDLADASINPYGPFCSADNSVILVGADQGGTWSGPGVDAITGEFNPALANIGNNTIVYTISGACGDSQSIQIEVIESPVVTAGGDETILFGNTVNLTAAGTFGTYQWSPITNVDCPICQNSTASPENTTTYIITQENNGCFASDEMIITVEYEPYVFVPNIFSPNNDNQNDALFVRGTGISTIEFLVFDRWGEKVFETNSLEIGWDGTFRGQDMSPGVFMYVASVTFTDGSNSIVKGDVTLIR